jgi:hypothetical protein
MTAAKPVDPPTKTECVDCAKLPYKLADAALGEEALYGGWRSKPPRKIDPRSLETHKTQPRCRTHWLAWRNAQRATQRTGHKAATYGVPRAIQAALWEYQGSMCPCGRKAAKEIPPGVTLDHEHGAPCIIRGDHDEKRGCLECVTGFVCGHCNREIIGRLEGAFRKKLDPRVYVREALRGLVDHLADPPLRRLLAERPDLLEQAS